MSTLSLPGDSSAHLAPATVLQNVAHCCQTHNCAACVAALGIHWMKGDVQRDRGPKPVRSYWTMEVIKRGLASDGTKGSRAKPR